MCCCNEFYYYMWSFFVGCNKNTMINMVRLTYPGADIISIYKDELLHLNDCNNNRVIIIFDADYNVIQIPIIG
jgi:hypothetical protein